MNRRLLLLSLSLLLIAGGQPARADTNASDEIQILPGYSSDASLKYYLGQKGKLQKKRFLTEGSVAVDYALLSWGDWSLIGDILMQCGMGESVTDNLPFSPLEMHYELTPFLERRGENLLWRLGWTHACDHLIYKDVEQPWYTEEGQNIEPDVYYNRIFAGAGTPAIRMPIQRQAFLKPGTAPRPPLGLVWYVEAGYYLRSLGDSIDSKSLSGHNDWAWDFKGEVRVPLWTGRSAALFANSRTHLLLDEDGGAFWREKLELELLFAGGSYGSSVFFGAYVVDEHPRDSREDLQDIGLRFYF
jgi:hypothetical protein